MENLSKEVGLKLLENGLLLVTAESCTAGEIAGAIAKTSGSSAWLEGGFIVYSIAAKQKYLGLGAELFEKYYVVSEEVAKAMALGAIDKSVGANISVAITGLANPGFSDRSDVPAGTIWIACWNNKTKKMVTSKLSLPYSRNTNRLICVEEAIKLVLTNS